MKRDVQPCLPTHIMLLSLILALVAVNPQALSHQEELKRLLSEAEWQTYIGPEENEGVELVWADSERHGDRLELVVHGERVSLDLEPAGDLLDPRFVLISRRHNTSLLLDPRIAEPSCHFRSPARAALFLCRGISGIISSGNKDSYYLITPVRRRLGKRSAGMPHLVVKKRMSPAGLSGLRRDVRSTEQSPPVHVETAVFVDRDLYTHMTTNFPSDTEREVVKFVLTMVNAVQMLYHDPSLGQEVSFVVKRLEILHIEPAGLVRSEDIDRFLGNFCAWQKAENPGDDSNPLHWDHALILTGLDLYVLSKNGKISKQVVGLAPVAGMCTATSSCTVNEGRHFESVYVVAHEIGHKSVSTLVSISTIVYNKEIKPYHQYWSLFT